jgi:parvulin-like peptidyl-prolyl isomerase
MTHARRLIGLIWVPLLLLVACGKRTENLPVAKIQGRVITVGDYEHAYETIKPVFLPKSIDEEGRREFLETMIKSEMIVLKADELGYDKDAWVVQSMENYKRVGLHAAYLKIKFLDKIKVTERDLKETYKKYGLVYEVKQILSDTEEEAYRVHDLLKEGHDFESVCKQYSKGPDAGEGGTLVTAYYGQFPPDFQDELFSTDVGGITKPVVSRWGYFVMKVLNKRHPAQKPFEEVRPELEKMAETQAQLRLRKEISDGVREKYGVEFYEDNMVIVFNSLPPDIPVTTPPNRSEEIYPLLDLEPEDLDKPLVSDHKRTITIGDFSDLYDRASFIQRPRREFRLGAIKKFLTDIVMNELVVEEIESSGVEGEPEVVEMLRRKREGFMVSKLHQDLVLQQVSVPMAEIEQYYEEHKESYWVSPQRRFHIILTGDKETAEKARQRVLTGEDFEEVGNQYASHEELTKTRAHNRFISQGESPEMDAYAFTLSDVGDISEPFEIADGWVVAKVVDVRPERYLSIGDVRDSIEHRLRTQKSDDRLDELLAKWRQEFDIEIYEENLQKAEISPRS